MAADEKNYRMERIGRLLHELQYEVTRGMMEREIDENLGFRFVVPISHAIRDGVVVCEFRTRPCDRTNWMVIADLTEAPRLRVVK